MERLRLALLTLRLSFVIEVTLDGEKLETIPLVPLNFVGVRDLTVSPISMRFPSLSLRLFPSLETLSFAAGLRSTVSCSLERKRSSVWMLSSSRQISSLNSLNSVNLCIKSLILRLVSRLDMRSFEKTFIYF